MNLKEMCWEQLKNETVKRLSRFWFYGILWTRPLTFWVGSGCVVPSVIPHFVHELIWVHCCRSTSCLRVRCADLRKWGFRQHFLACLPSLFCSEKVGSQQRSRYGWNVTIIPLWVGLSSSVQPQDTHLPWLKTRTWTRGEGKACCSTRGFNQGPLLLTLFVFGVHSAYSFPLCFHISFSLASFPSPPSLQTAESSLPRFKTTRPFWSLNRSFCFLFLSRRKRLSSAHYKRSQHSGAMLETPARKKPAEADLAGKDYWWPFTTNTEPAASPAVHR